MSNINIYRFRENNNFRTQVKDMTDMPRSVLKLYLMFTSDVMPGKYSACDLRFTAKGGPGVGL